MCYKWQEIIDHNALPAFNDWQRTLDSLKVLRGNQDMQVIFAGGEVLQYNNILELIRFAGERGFSTVLTSSGFLLDDMMISIITTLYFLQDGLGTAGNVMGDGALMIIVNKILK